MRIAVVFDATAVDAYGRGSVAVGEILAEILDTREDGETVYAALPAVCLLAAMGTQNAMDVYRLAAHPATTIVSTLADDTYPAARIAEALNLPGDAGAALYLALNEGAQLLTGYGAAMRKSNHPAVIETIIDIADEH